MTNKKKLLKKLEPVQKSIEQKLDVVLYKTFSADEWHEDGPAQEALKTILDCESRYGRDNIAVICYFGGEITNWNWSKRDESLWGLFVRKETYLSEYRRGRLN